MNRRGASKLAPTGGHGYSLAMFLRACIRCAWPAMLLLAVAGCATNPATPKLFVETRHENDIAFERYATYAWLDGEHGRDNPTFLAYPELPGLIGSAVDRELAAKGFEKRPPGEADFLVAMSASVQDITLISKRRYSGWSHGYDRTSPPTLDTATRLDKMAEGTLVIEVVDVASEGVVWQCQAAGVVTRREGLEHAVNSAVARMLEAFPPSS